MATILISKCASTISLNTHYPDFLLTYGGAARLLVTRYLFFYQWWLNMEHHVQVCIIAPGWESVNLSKFTHHPPKFRYSYREGKGGRTDREGRGGRTDREGRGGRTDREGRGGHADRRGGEAAMLIGEVER